MITFLKIQPLLRPFRRFLREERGAILAETVIVLPVLFWAYLGSYVYFDAFSTKNTAMRATYTIADLISRQTNTLTPSDIEGMNKVFDFITAAPRRGFTTHIRVTDVSYDLKKKIMVESWESFTPAFNIGLSEKNFYNTVIVRPRMSPNVDFQGNGNGGGGNGNEHGKGHEDSNS
jgi:hypothetical protein